MAEEPAAVPRRSRVSGKVVLATTFGALLVVGAGLGLALSEAGASTAAVVASGCGSTNPRLTVQGTGQASGTPDVLTAVFGFSTTGASSASALAANNAKVSQALAALAANGVVRHDVQTTGLSLSAQYAYPKGVPTLTGYLVSNTVAATLRDTNTAGAAIDAVVDASGDAVQINSLTFSFGNPAKVADEARTDAVHQAVAHAGAMAMAAGRKLGPVCALTDDTQPSQVPQNLGVAAAGTSAPSSAVPVEPGTQVETDQVTMVYALAQR